MKSGLELSYGKANLHKTRFQLANNVWHFVALTWSARLKEATLHVISSAVPGKVRTSKWEVAGKPFIAGGTLSIGKFQISETQRKWKKPDLFVGCYDTLGFSNM